MYDLSFSSSAIDIRPDSAYIVDMQSNVFKIDNYGATENGWKSALAGEPLIPVDEYGHTDERAAYDWTRKMLSCGYSTVVELCDGEGGLYLEAR